MRRTTLERILIIERMAYDGFSLREIAGTIQAGTNTVMKYFPREAKCECGKLLIEHKGWCPARYAGSPARQAVMKELHRKRSANAKR